MAPKALMILLLTASAVHIWASGNEENTEGILEAGIVKTAPSSNNQALPEAEILKIILSQQKFEGKTTGQYFDNMPYSLRVVFETTVQLETILYSMVLLYGLLHLAYHLGKW